MMRRNGLPQMFAVFQLTQWCHVEALSILRRDNIIIVTDQSVQNTDLFSLLQKATEFSLEQQKLENDRCQREPGKHKRH
jgi:hypothetical protein